ncbi:MAG: FecR domain-containing protein, partial [Phycisphaeraceae bacterium]
MDKSDALIDAYLDHTIDDEQFESLCDWLREDAAHRKTFARKLAMHSAITEWCVERSGGLLADELQTAEEATARQERTWIDELADLTDPAEQSAPADKPLTSRELIALIGFAFGEALTTKAAYKAFAIAAAVLLAVTLFFVFTGGDETPTHAPFASDNTPNDPSEPGRDGPDAPNPVATLTAEHDAVWSLNPGESLRPGSALASDQRLTLTAGLAEITTARGAIAILEAPATIQLINDNALRLHAGKLVGICETDASKGFLVRTPHMDITDLGTRFAVNASSDEQTEVHVIDGEVEVARPSLAGGAVIRENIVAGDAVLASSSSDELTRIQTNDLRFATLLAFDADLSERRGLVAHWRFDDPQRLGLNAHRDVEDLQAKGDATHTPQGRFGGGLLLDDDGDALIAATFPDGIPAGGAAHTVALWIKPTATG